MATGFSPNPRGGWIISTTFPNRRQASTMSPDCSSVYSSPGGAPQCDWMESRGPFGIGGVARDPVRALLLERERHRDQSAVELGDRDLHGGVDRGQRGVRGLPLLARAGQAEALQHRHVQAAQQASVPVALAGG